MQKEKKKIYLSSPHLSGNEIFFIQDALDKNWVSSLGENLDFFEQEIANFLEIDSQCIVALNSATSALHLALILLGIEKNDEVICQSFTFIASINPFIYQGVKPIFVDSELETWNLCPNILEQTILDRIKKGKKPKAIILVHLYGMPAKMSEILEISQKYEIPIIEDAAEAMGSLYKGEKCGLFGQMAVFSFNGNKIITTSGGGALICKDKFQREKAFFLATQAKDKAPHYQHSTIGYNYRMSNILAGVGRGQMQVLDQRIAQRRKNNEFYKKELKKIQGIEVFSEPNLDFFSNHWLSVVLVNKEKTGFDREELRLKFLEENIETRPVWKPMHLQPVFKNCPYYGEKNAENLFEKGLCLPSGSNLTDEDLQRVLAVFESMRN